MTMVLLKPVPDTRKIALHSPVESTHGEDPRTRVVSDEIFDRASNNSARHPTLLCERIADRGIVRS
jgi:hypothetical protein